MHVIRQALRHSIVPIAIFAGAVLTLAIAASPANAQDPAGESRILGLAIDEETGDPVPDVTVRLGTAGEARVSDEDGRFVFENVAVGTYSLLVEHVAYATVEDTIRVDQADRTYTVEVRLAVEPIAVDAISVEVLPPVGVREDVEARVERMRRLGIGRIFTREEIEEHNSARVTTLLERAPGVHLVQTGPSAGSVAVVFGRGALRCEPAFYLDGVRQTGEGSNPDAYITALDLETIEVYRGAAAAQGEFEADGCGVIALWTRRGGDDGSGLTWGRMIVAGAAAGLLWLVTQTVMP